MGGVGFGLVLLRSFGDLRVCTVIYFMFTWPKTLGETLQLRSHPQRRDWAGAGGRNERLR